MTPWRSYRLRHQARHADGTYVARLWSIRASNYVGRHQAKEEGS